MSKTMPTNPYIAGDPVSGSGRFIGRVDVLRDVLRVLRNPNTNALVLYGQRRIGKTSILLQLRQQLLKNKEYIPVYFDLQDKAALPLASVLYQLAQRIAEVVDMDQPDRKQFDRAGQFFRETFLPKAASKVGQRGLVLLFDEFDVLDLPHKGQAGESFFPYLRGWISEASDVQFVFVLGRRPDDLSIDTLATLKNVGQRQVSLMNREDSLTIIRQSENAGGLGWKTDGLELVWQWAQGHPYLTQLLCSEIWELAYDNEPETTLYIDANAVGEAIPKALELGEHAFLWIWDGLPPAERIVMAAMAEVDHPVLNQEELANILTHSGVRLILRELELAPETLVRWDLLRPANGGFRFAVPLLKKWVAENKPLKRVKKELDSLEPLANALYRSAEGIYGFGELGETAQLLRRALNINPNHMQARLLLGRVFLGQGDLQAAINELELVYEFERSLALQDLIGAFLALAESQQDDNDKLALYERVLALNPVQPAALKEKQRIWQKRGDAAQKSGDLESALAHYQEGGLSDLVEQVKTLLKQNRMRYLWEELAELEKERRYEEALQFLDEKLNDPDLLEEIGDWHEYRENLVEKMRLKNTFERGVAALRDGNRDQAKGLFAEVVAKEADYPDAIRYLFLTIYGKDIVEWKEQSELAEKVRQDALLIVYGDDTSYTLRRKRKSALILLVFSLVTLCILVGWSLFNQQHRGWLSSTDLTVTYAIGEVPGQQTLTAQAFTHTPTITPSITPTPSLTPTPSITPSPTPTSTVTPTPTSTSRPIPIGCLPRFGGDNNGHINNTIDTSIAVNDTNPVSVRWYIKSYSLRCSETDLLAHLFELRPFEHVEIGRVLPDGTVDIMATPETLEGEVVKMQLASPVYSLDYDQDSGSYVLETTIFITSQRLGRFRGYSEWQLVFTNAAGIQDVATIIRLDWNLLIATATATPTPTMTRTPTPPAARITLIGVNPSTQGEAPSRVDFYSGYCSDWNPITGTSRTYRYVWDFGDGNSSAHPCPVHVYQIPGEYVVTLAICSNLLGGRCGATDRITINVR
jgi:hypothetical protein